MTPYILLRTTTTSPLRLPTGRDLRLRKGRSAVARVQDHETLTDDSDLAHRLFRYDRGKMRSLAWVILILSSACAATTATYDGPRRPWGEVSTIHSFDFEIETVDGKSGGVFSNRFEVLPGQHLLQVRMEARRDFGSAYSRDSRRLCFTAGPGRDYVVIPRVLAVKGASFLWIAEVYDQVANLRLRVRYLKASDNVCPPPLVVQPWQQNVPAPNEAPPAP
jgi:hypothetical protein